jgi:hypothetical protein
MEPESEDMNTRLWKCSKGWARSFEAVLRGPSVFVVRWCRKEVELRVVRVKTGLMEKRGGKNELK